MISQVRHPDVRLVLHGHFYQPPRESPWTDEVPQQDSAAPHHDWNQRVYSECYRPNTASRFLDGVGRIRAIVNNFAYLNFNVGPTLMRWLERQHPDTHARIVEADRSSVQVHSGHGNALAQAYHHIIMPLANDRDRQTQVLWGLRDFEYRFGRVAEGMWLPETAINMSTVETLIDCGVRFTVLSPYQARRVRPLQGGSWKEVSGGHVDPRLPYRVFGKPAADGTPRFLDVFFYDGPISRAMAFENLLRSAETLSDRLALAVDPGRKQMQVVSVAVDGETFGHHSAFGDMCLAAFFIEKSRPRGLRVSNYGECLELLPPTHEVELETGQHDEGTAWSCAHGVGRWIRDCGCSTGGPEHWKQDWRQPLRSALDRLRDVVALEFERRGSELFHDSWRARDEYVDVVVRFSSHESVETFLGRHLREAADARGRVQALELLEAQRYAMSMYTSCAWFFTEITGIETVQNLRYAARCIQLMQAHSEVDLESMFLEPLESAHSNNGRDTGATIYRNWVLSEVRTPERAVSARAIFRLLETSSGSPQVYGFDVREGDPEKIELKPYAAMRGRMWLHDRWTTAETEWSYLAIAYSARDLHCFVTAADALEHAQLSTRLAGLPKGLGRDELEESLTEMFGAHSFGILDLLPDQRRRIAQRLAEERILQLRRQYRAVFEDNLHLLEDYADMQLDLPDELRVPCETTLQSDLLEAAERLLPPYDPTETVALEDVLALAKRLRLEIDLKPAAAVLGEHLVESLEALLRTRELQHFTAAENLLRLVEDMKLPIERTKSEELAFHLFQDHVLHAHGAARPSEEYLQRAVALAARLNIVVDEVQEPARN